jgi:hypothetical protein
MLKIATTPTDTFNRVTVSGHRYTPVPADGCLSDRKSKMDRQQTRLVVLARIPCLNDGECGGSKISPAIKGRGALASSCRLISQTISCKLLAGITLFLLLAAILPHVTIKKSSPSKMTNESVAAQGSESPSKTALNSSQAVVQSAARPPVVMVAATPARSAPPVAVPTLPPEKQGNSQANKVDDSPMMSDWPGSNQPRIK